MAARPSLAHGILFFARVFPFAKEAFIGIAIGGTIIGGVLNPIKDGYYNRGFRGVGV